MTNQAIPPKLTEDDSDEINIAEYLGTLIESRWLIGTAVAVALTLGIAYAVLARPVYRSDVLLQVEQKSGGLGGLDELSSMFADQTPAEAEIEILRSRSLLGAVVDELRLDLHAKPKHFPIVGAGIARLRDGNELASPVLGLSRFAWGGERIKLERFEVPEELEGERFTLVATGESAFSLLDEDGESVLSGKVGALAETKQPGVGQFGIFVSELMARPGTHFVVSRIPRNTTIDELQKGLVMMEKGKKSGILSVALEGPNRRKVAATLDAIANAYLRQNVDRRSEEAEKTLAFLTGQMPELKANLEKAEAALNMYRSGRGSVDLGLETQAVLERSVDVEKQLSALALERSELKQRFTESHPVLAALRQKIERLEVERASANSVLKSLPEAELNSARLMRDVKVANELYLLLLNKSQELKVVKSGTIGNVRILDSAIISREPVRPKKALALLLSVVAGLGVGLTLAFARKALTRGIEDPDSVEKSLGISVYATVPLSEKQVTLTRLFQRKGQTQTPVLAADDPADLSVESIRSLRTSLQFALMDAKNNVLAISGPSPGVGKSFVSANLAQVLGDSGMRVLLVDGDMRRGRLHEYFDGERAGGLSEIISGKAEFAAAVRKREGISFSFIPSGVVPPNPSELLMSPRFQRFVEEASKSYELVIIDTPPILAVTDGSIVGRSAGVNLVVLRSGMHPMREVALTAKRLEQNGVRLHGVVFNGMPRRTGLLSKHSYHYQYDYKS